MSTRLKLEIIVCLHIVFACMLITTVKAQNPTVQYPVKMDVSLPLIQMQPAIKDATEQGENEEERAVPNKIRRFPDADPNWIDPVLQKYYNMPSSKAPMANPILNINGINNGSNPGRYTPPDPAGDVGPNHYVQVVNVSLQIFNKTGTSLYGPVTTSTIWSGFTGAWTGHNDGDAIVLYDENADRWIISQFAVDCGTYPAYTEYELVAVSTTSDPTGTYYRYAFQFDYMPDYPKLGVWNDGYYMAVNRFNTNVTPNTYIGAAACVMERSKMLTGDPTARLTYFKTETLGGTGVGAGSNCWAMLPSDCDGTMPPAGTPNYFAYIDPDYVSATQMMIWAFHTDWTTPANSTFTYNTAITVATMSALGSVPQSGSTSVLDALSDRLMFRNQYHNFGTYESFVTCHSVSSGATGGIRWYEYRRTGGVFSLYQQGTYVPADTKYRWMGSIAMNNSGDIGLIYTASSSSSFPSIYFTGRKAGDPLGTMTLPEGTIQTGTASISGTYGYRWGDYSALNVDPTDNLTFWGTHEYVGTYGGSYPWSTKIASFKIPHTPVATTLAASAITGTTATLNGIVNPSGQASTYHFEWGTSVSYGNTTSEISAGSGSSDVAVNAPIIGLVVGTVYHFRIVATNVDGSVNGSDLTLTPGGAILTTTAPSAITQNSATAGGNITIDGGFSVTARGVCWSTSANPIASGSHTTDGSGTGTFISSITGLLSNTLYHVRAYATNANGTFYGDDQTFTTLCGTNLALPFNENFDLVTFPPSCWAKYRGTNGLGTLQDWVRTTTTPYAVASAYVRYEAVTGGNAEDWLVTPYITLPASGTTTLSFYQKQTYSSDYGSYYYIKVSTTSQILQSSFADVTSYGETSFSTAYTLKSVDLSAYNGQSIYIAFVMVNNDGDNWYIDNVNLDNTNNYWSGASSSVWELAGNWSKGIPTISSGIVIPPVTNLPTITSLPASPAVCNNMIIMPGASVTVNAGKSLTISGTVTNSAGATGIVIKSDATGTGSLITNSSVPSTVERYITGSTGSPLPWHFISPPVNGQSIPSYVGATTNIATNGTKYGLAPYDNSIPNWVPYTTSTLAGAGNFAVAKGYELLLTANSTTTFTGTIAGSDKNIAVNTPTSPGTAWNLIGNPFTSAINANANAHATNNFLSVNSAIFESGYQAVYFWNSATGSYGLPVNNATAATYIPLGQAFFVKSKAGGATASFTTAMRTHDATALHKNSENQYPLISLKADFADKISQTDIYFIPGATTEIDEGYDAGIYTVGNTDKTVYTHIEGSDIGFAIQSLPAEVYTGCYVQVGLDAKRGSEVTFSAGLFNLPADEMVYLRDIFAGTSTCLSIPGNTYKVVLNDDYSGTGRFYLTMSQLTVGSQAIQEDLYSVVPVPRQNILRLAGHFVPGSKVAVYDISGRVIDSYSISNEGINELHFSPASSGVYMVRIQSGSSVINRKFSWVY